MFLRPGEAGPFIIVGHSVGVELSQVLNREPVHSLTAVIESGSGERSLRYMFTCL